MQNLLRVHAASSREGRGDRDKSYAVVTDAEHGSLLLVCDALADIPNGTKAGPISCKVVTDAMNGAKGDSPGRMREAKLAADHAVTVALRENGGDPLEAALAMAFVTGDSLHVAASGSCGVLVVRKGEVARPDTDGAPWALEPGDHIVVGSRSLFGALDELSIPEIVESHSPERSTERLLAEGAVRKLEGDVTVVVAAFQDTNIDTVVDGVRAQLDDDMATDAPAPQRGTFPGDEESAIDAATAPGTQEREDLPDLVEDTPAPRAPRKAVEAAAATPAKASGGLPIPLLVGGVVVVVVVVIAAIAFSG